MHGRLSHAPSSPSPSPVIQSLRWMDAAVKMMNVNKQTKTTAKLNKLSTSFFTDCVSRYSGHQRQAVKVSCSMDSEVRFRKVHHSGLESTFMVKLVTAGFFVHTHAHLLEYPCTQLTSSHVIHHHFPTSSPSLIAVEPVIFFFFRSLFHLTHYSCPFYRCVSDNTDAPLMDVSLDKEEEPRSAHFM